MKNVLAAAVLTSALLAGCGKNDAGATSAIPPATAPGGAVITLSVAATAPADPNSPSLGIHIHNAGTGTFGFVDHARPATDFDIQVLDAKGNPVAHRTQVEPTTRDTETANSQFRILVPGSDFDLDLNLRENFDLKTAGQYRVFVSGDLFVIGADQPLHSVSAPATFEIH